METVWHSVFVEFTVFLLLLLLLSSNLSDDVGSNFNVVYLSGMNVLSDSSLNNCLCVGVWFL